MFEVEIKIKLRDPKTVRKQLLAMKAIKLYDMENTDIYYNAPVGTRDFHQTDEALRLRKTVLFDSNTHVQTKESHDLTYKGPKLDKVVKTRIEHVCRILDPEKMDEIVLALGYSKVATIPKKREVYEVDYKGKQIEIVIDQVEGLDGWFLEAEMMAESEYAKESTKQHIIDFIVAIGYTKEDSIRKSYLEMVLENKQN
jgi:adenylate cyclase, class 2